MMNKNNKNKMFDAIVVGARCAGSNMATRLAQAGFEVLLVDRSFFPSDVISTHTIFNNTVHCLRETGVLDKLLETDTPAMNHCRLQHDDVVIEGIMPDYHGETYSYCFRRTHFDKILLDHARSHDNVTAVEGFRVTELIREGDTVVGIRGRDREENVSEYFGKIVIGADGRNSTVRREAGAVQKTATPTEWATYYGYFEGVHNFDHTQFEISTNGVYRAYVFPTTNKQHVVVANLPLSDSRLMNGFKTEPEATIRELYAEHFPRQAERIADATLAEPMKGIIAYDNYWYQGMGQGYALVGDSVCFKDPGLGQGIHDAVFGAKILTEVLIKHLDLGWDMSWSEMAAEYQSIIEDEFMARYEVACRLTKVSSHTKEELAMYRQIKNDEVAKAKYLGFYNYTADHNDLTLALTREIKQEHQAVS